LPNDRNRIGGLRLAARRRTGDSVKGAGRWLALPLALAFMVRIAGAGLLREPKGFGSGDHSLIERPMIT